MTALSGKKNPARGPYRKKLDRSRARDKPIKFEDLGIRSAQMLEKKIRTDMLIRAGHVVRAWMLLKRGMGNGEWGMRNGEWGMGN